MLLHTERVGQELSINHKSIRGSQFRHERNGIVRKYLTKDIDDRFVSPYRKDWTKRNGNIRSICRSASKGWNLRETGEKDLRLIRNDLTIIINQLLN